MSARHGCGGSKNAGLSMRGSTKAESPRDFTARRNARSCASCSPYVNPGFVMSGIETSGKTASVSTPRSFSFFIAASPASDSSVAFPTGGEPRPADLVLARASASGPGGARPATAGRDGDGEEHDELEHRYGQLCRSWTTTERPPSTTRVVPVMNDASGEARNTAARAASSGVPDAAEGVHREDPVEVGLGIGRRRGAAARGGRPGCSRAAACSRGCCGARNRSPCCGTSRAWRPASSRAGTGAASCGRRASSDTFTIAPPWAAFMNGIA